MSKREGYDWKPLEYIRNAKSFNGWKKTVDIAISKAETIEHWSNIVEECYDKHDWFVYSVGIRYGLGASPYGDVLDAINKRTRSWYEDYCKSRGLDPIKESGGIYGFTHY